MTLSFFKKTVLVVLFLLIFFNSSRQPEIVDLHLDPSWKAVLQYSQANRLSIGDDIAFTYGPLGFLTSSMHIFVGYKSLAWAGFFAGISWSCALAISCLYLTEKLPYLTRIVILLICAFFQGMLMDSAHYFILLSTGIYLLNYTSFHKSNLSKWTILLIASFTVALTKFTYLPIFTITFLFAISCNIIQKQYTHAIFTFTITLTLAVITSLATNTTITSFFHFIVNSIHISSGYNQSMMIVPTIDILIFGLITLSSLTLLFFLGFLRPKQSQFPFDTFLFALITFTTWKAGYTRADGHVFIFLNYGVLCICYGLWLYSKAKPKHRNIFVFCSILPLISLIGSIYTYSNLPHKSKFGSFKQLVFSPYQKIQRFASFRSYIADLDERWSKTKANYSNRLKNLTGNSPVDVFGCLQGIAIVNQLNYFPNPTIQSYTAYNKTTQKLGIKSHLDHPRNILFRLDAIDRRLPTMDDALLQRHVLWNMDYREQIGNHLLFSPKEKISREIMDMDFPEYENCNFGDWIELTNQNSGCVFLNAKFEQNLLGKLLSVLYKSSIVHVTVELNSGQTFRYRYIPCAGEFGVLVSPLLETNKDIRDLVKSSTDEHSTRNKDSNFATSDSQAVPNIHHRTVRRIKFTSDTNNSTPLGYTNKIEYALKMVSRPN